MTTSRLPPHVYAVKDRHGKTRYRFRRKGWAAPYLPGTPGDAVFHAAYAEIIKAGPSAPIPVKAIRKVVPRSLDDLLARMKAGTKWQKKAPETQRRQARMLETFVDTKASSGRRYGERPVAAVTVAWLDKIFAGMSKTPAQANVLRKTLSGMMDHALKLDWRRDNPVRLTESYKEGQGYHTWSEEEIAQYRTTHALGTMARLTLELALNTAARRCNLAMITRDDIKGDRILVNHAKGNNATSVTLMALTREAIDSLPVSPIKHLVVTQSGKPFTVAGLGNRMRKWCDEAGLKGCSMHGLRKAMSRRIAESGGTDAQGQAITGHRKASTFVKYREEANRVMLAGNGVSNVESMFDVQPTKE